MFTESLLESSNVARKHSDKRWPMTLAFVLESIAVCFLLLLPLASTGVIPVLAHVPHPIAFPMNSVDIADHAHSNSSETRGVAAGAAPVVRVFNNRSLLDFRHSQPTGESAIDPLNPIRGEGQHIGDLICELDCTTIARPPEPLKRVHLSHPEEALLIRKVDPVYPRTAVLTRTYGTVQLHAVIAKDGTIQSLSVVSGHPILAQAALDAVRQWRYKPYMLNDEPVEVETFITVNFRSAAN
jgi:protein TonB